MSQPRIKRRIKLIEPRFQLRLTLVFVGLSAMALLLQYILFTRALASIALALPEDGLLLMDRASGVLLGVLATSFLLFLPLIFTVGVLTTFRIAGPMYRFRQFLNDVKRGEQSAPCRIREGDEFQDFCELLNEVTDPLRRSRSEGAGDEVPEEAPGETLAGHGLRRSA